MLGAISGIWMSCHVESGYSPIKLIDLVIRRCCKTDFKGELTVLYIWKPNYNEVFVIPGNIRAFVNFSVKNIKANLAKYEK